MFNNMLMGAAGQSTKATSFSVDNSGVFDDGSSQYLLRTPDAVATSSKTNTVSFWFKRGTLATTYRILNGRNSGGTGAYQLGIGSDDKFNFHPSISVAGEMNTTMLFRDPHAWYHVVAALDTRQGTESNRYAFWVNGVNMSSDLSGAKPAQNLTVKLNEKDVNQVIAAYQDSSFMNYWDGYLAEFVVIDGQKLDADSFGEYDDNGVWRPIDLISSGVFDASNSVTPTATTWELGSTMSAGTGTLDKSGAGGTSAAYARTLIDDFKVTFTAAALNDAVFGVFDYNELGTFNSSQDDGFLDSMTNSFWYDEGQTDVNYGNTTVAASKTIAAGSVVTIERSGSTIKITDDGSDVHEFTQTFSGPVGFIAGHRNTGANSLDFNSISFDGVSGIGNNGFYLPFTGSGALGADYSVTRTAPSISFLTSAYDTSNAQNYTFSSQSLGTAASNRKIIACVGASAVSVSTLSISSVTIGGVTATQIVAGNADNNNSLQPFAIFIADVPSGTSGDVVVSLNANNGANCAIALYRATEVGPTIYSDATNGGSFPSPNTVSLVAQASKNSVILSHGVKNGQTVRVTLAGVTEEYDFGGEDDMAIFGGINTSATSSDAVGLTTSATVDSGSASYLGIATIVIGGVGDTSFKEVNSPTQTTDSPTTNAATFSPLITRHQTSFAAVTSDWTFTNGNRTLTHTSGSSGDIMAAASQLLQPGQKYHFEAVTESMHSSQYARFALALVPQSMYEADASPLTGTNDQFEISLIKSGGTGSNSAAFDDSSLTAPTNKPTTNSRLTFEVDMSTISSTTVRYYFDGSLDTTYSSLAFADEPYYVVSFTGVETDRNGVFNFNFGSSAFTDTPTSGHTGLTAKDAFAGSAPTIEDGSAYFQATTYSGNGTTNEINQSGNSTFQPDMVWLKERSGGNHGTIIDAVRGANKGLYPSLSFVEYTESNLSFDADGFSLSTTGSAAQVNASGQTYIGWQWLAGNSTASNSNGSITSTVSVNQTAGFSIVSWTGSGANATIGHGLNAVPSWIIVKNRDSAGNNWPVYHVGTDNTHVTFLDQDSAESATDRWQDTTPTSTVFSVDGTTDVNKSTDNMIAYCWCEKPGFSKFGTYGANANADGPFIETGFKPAFFLTRPIGTASDWSIFDNGRSPENVMNASLAPNTNAADYTHSSAKMDFLSNGVKIRGTFAPFNSSSQTIMYAAFAENPFAGTTPITAR